MGHRSQARKRLLKYREIPQGWECHHCDRNIKNKRLDNLVSLTHRFHKALHKVIDQRRKDFTLDEVLVLFQVVNEPKNIQSGVDLILDYLKQPKIYAYQPRIS